MKSRSGPTASTPVLVDKHTGSNCLVYKADPGSWPIRHSVRLVQRESTQHHKGIDTVHRASPSVRFHSRRPRVSIDAAPGAVDVFCGWFRGGCGHALRWQSLMRRATARSRILPSFSFPLGCLSQGTERSYRDNDRGERRSDEATNQDCDLGGRLGLARFFGCFVILKRRTSAVSPIVRMQVREKECRCRKGRRE